MLLRKNKYFYGNKMAARMFLQFNYVTNHPALARNGVTGKVRTMS